MLSYRNLKNYPAGRPLGADDVLEFHAARLLLLLLLCGKAGQIDGLTKLAKLDFFVRYPSFFARTCEYLGKGVPDVKSTIEAPMVRHHYGPWDHRYYHVLAYLEGAELMTVKKAGARKYVFALTDTGTAVAERLAKKPTFSDLTQQMRNVKKVLGTRSGESLKNLIYDVFKREVAEREMGEEIR